MRWVLAITLIYTTISSTVVEYRFGHNFGQIYHDYSDNGRDGVNGQSSSTTTKDAKNTDRGAFFGDNRDSLVTVPPNDIVTSGFSLGSTFVVLLWILPFDDYSFYIFYRKNSDNSEYFAIQRNSDNDCFYFRVKNSGGTYSKDTSTESFPKGKS